MADVRILFVYQFLTPGGVETVILARMEELIRRGIGCRALFFSDLGGRSLFSALESRIVVAGELEAQLQVVRDYRPTHLVSFDSPQMLAFLRSIDPSVFVVYEVHTIYPEYFEPLKDHEWMSAVDRFLVPSDYQRQVVQGYLPAGAPIGVVPDSLVPAFLEPAHAVPAPGGESPVVLWVGRLDDVKYWQGFLEIGEGLVRTEPAVRLWMVGGLNSGELAQARLWEEMKSRQLTDALRWLPAVDHSAMPDVYRHVAAAGGCLLSTSRTESFGVAVLEAMACGLAVVVPDVGALPSLVEDGRSGRLYRFGDAQAAERAVLVLLHDSESRRQLGAEAAAVARRYSVERIIDRFLEELAGPRSAASGPG